MSLEPIGPAEDVGVQVSDDPVKSDLELTCHRCGHVICDVEHGDTLGTLVRTAEDHLLTCTPKDAATTKGVTTA